MKKNDFEFTVKRLFKQIQALENDNQALSDNALLENTYFLKDDAILCKERQVGVSRFPYGTDGFTLWAYSSGYISANESTFYIILPSEEGKEPYCAFFGGEKQVNGQYMPISLLGRAKSPLEKKVRRYCVYTKECVYYLTKTNNFDYAVRFFVSDEKEIIISTLAINRTNKARDIYLSSFMNCLFKYANGESMETKWFKKCTYADDSFAFYSPEDIDRKTHIDNYGFIERSIINGQPTMLFNTTARADYVGGSENSLVNAPGLISGSLVREKLVTHFTDMPVAGDLLRFTVDGHTSIKINYVISFAHNEQDYMKRSKRRLSDDEVEKLVQNKRRQFVLQNDNRSMLKIEFEEWRNDSLKTSVLNRFLRYVMYQTEYCGLAKNSGAVYLGVRDVMQQVEAALMWNPKACRRKILEVLSYLDTSGNPPRQYSIPPKGATPLMDLRDFIDQGVWIISTIYRYLAHTGDYSILKEICGYYDRIGGNAVKLSPVRDSVLDHIIRVMNYLIAHIDESTHCLRAMYGDWNDALDGLGISSDGQQEYGSGVSVMATLQLYKNLQEMQEILTKINASDQLVRQYGEIRTDIEAGLKEYAIVEKDGERRIVHGWGDKKAYYVGSFDDVDHQSRNSLTVNAFYVLSNMNEKGYLSKEDTLRAYDNLDSKYGLKTFEPYFAEDAKGVGRIVRLPKGTAENAATYIHGTLFGILSLFLLNEGERAYDQLEKILPLTHSHLTTSPFVMPNSYSYNLEEGMDGESMSDWYTGSANTLIKALIQGSFGLVATLAGIKITPFQYFPSKKAKLAIKIRDCVVTIRYNNIKSNQRVVYVNSQQINEEVIEFDANYLDNHREVTIDIVD